MLDADFVRDALLRHNYFPNHRTKSSEMPPCFTTIALTPEVSAKVVGAKPYNGPHRGFDFTPYTLARFNGGPRLCGLPHPYAHCRLVENIYANWSRIEPLIQSNSSQIKANPHPDGRLFVMDYESQFSRSKSYLDRQASKQFIAKADISHFYPSIYTHSIAWAAVGIEEAKNNQSSGNKWYNKLDSTVRDCKRNETNGIIVGPGTSILISEIILSDVDRRLEAAGFSFLRFIDDYTCFCSSRENAHDFIRYLEVALSKFSLFLNFNKTHIGRLSGSEMPEWIPALQVDSLPKTPNFFSLKIYFSRAVALAEKHPDGSVLRYAVHALKGRKLSQQSGEYVLRTLLALSLHHPHLNGSLREFLKFGQRNGNFIYKNELYSLLEQSVQTRRSDAICWALYLLKITGHVVCGQLSQKIMKTHDPCALVILYEAGDTSTRRSITSYAKKAILARDHSVHERNWILLHYLLNEKRLKLADVTDKTLKLLRKEKVNLFDF